MTYNVFSGTLNLYLLNQSINQSQAQPGSAGKKPQNGFVCVCAISGFPNLTVHINQLSDY